MEDKAMESPKMYSSRRCKKRCYLCGSANNPSHVRQYRAENRNLRKFQPTFYHGAVFAPNQCLYQREARAMKSPKIYSSTRCIKLTYLCRSATYPVSCKAV